MNSVSQKVFSMSRVLVSASLMALLCGSLPLAAFAQEGIVARQAQIAKTDSTKNQQADAKPAEVVVQQQQQQPPQNLITQPLALSPEVPATRVGVKEGQQDLLTLRDAIARALQNNLNIEIARQDVQMAQQTLFGTRGPYDIVPSATFNYTSRTTPVTSVIQGGEGSEAITDRSLVYNVSLDHMIERTGARWSLDFNNSRFSSVGSAFENINPRYSPSLSISVAQPLMRNFKIDATRQTILLAKRSLDLSDSLFRQEVINIISSVQRAYWDLVFARRNEVVARNSVELTRTLLQNNQKMVEAGTLAPIELRATEAALEARKETVILALQSITTAENTLKALLIKESADRLWDSEIVPTDEPQFGTATFSLEEATVVALKNRPELDQLRLQTEQNQISQSYYKNQLKPQVDLIGFFTTAGTAGSVNQSDTDPTLPGSRVVPDRFLGGYFRALRNLGSLDFRTYQFGVSISFPWRNRTVEGNLGRALAQSRQLDARQRQQVQTIQIDVRNALQAVVATRQRYEAAKASRIAADAQLSGEQEKYRAGLSPNFLVLQRQNEFATAQAAEVRALTDYNKALADLQRVTGMTLIGNNIEVKAQQPNDVK
jgi:HAE1 family hydrophobic/amphiphilic exporter-1